MVMIDVSDIIRDVIIFGRNTRLYQDIGSAY